MPFDIKPPEYNSSSGWQGEQNLVKSFTKSHQELDKQYFSSTKENLFLGIGQHLLDDQVYAKNFKEKKFLCGCKSWQLFPTTHSGSFIYTIVKAQFMQTEKVCLPD